MEVGEKLKSVQETGWMPEKAATSYYSGWSRSRHEGVAGLLRSLRLPSKKAVIVMNQVGHDGDGMGHYEHGKPEKNGKERR